MDQHYSRGQVASLLGVSVNTVISLEKRRELRSVRVGERAVRIPAEAVEEYLRRRQTGQPAPAFRLAVNGKATARVVPPDESASNGPVG